MPESSKQKERPLRFVRPELYDLLLYELEQLNIHFFDVEAGATKKNTGVEIMLRFGEEFSHNACCFFTNEALGEPYHDVKLFFRQSATLSQRVIVAEYFKMMKP